MLKHDHGVGAVDAGDVVDDDDDKNDYDCGTICGGDKIKLAGKVLGHRSPIGSNTAPTSLMVLNSFLELFRVFSKILIVGQNLFQVGSRWAAGGQAESIFFNLSISTI